MDRNQARSLYIKIIFGALAFTSYTLVASVLSFKPETEPVSTIKSMVDLPTRLPAAIPSGLTKRLPGVAVFSQPPRAVEQVKIDVMAVSCWDASESQILNTSARWVRLTGRACGSEMKTDSWEVLNSSNGFSATVFSPSARALTTDYIPLNTGTNEIRFVAVSGDGVRHESVMKIDRVPVPFPRQDASE